VKLVLSIGWGVIDGWKLRTGNDFILERFYPGHF
jgi:hypothetical protein